MLLGTISPDRVLFAWSPCPATLSVCETDESAEVGSVFSGRAMRWRCSRIYFCFKISSPDVSLHSIESCIRLRGDGIEQEEALRTGQEFLAASSQVSQIILHPGIFASLTSST